MLPKLLFAVFAVVACFFCGQWLAQNAGFVQIIWLGHVVETSVSFCIALVLCAALIVHLLLLPFRSLDKIRTFLSNRKSEKAQLLLGQILTNIICNDTSTNDKLIKELEKTKKVSHGVILILKSKTSNTKEVFEELTKNSITAQIGWNGLIEYYLSRGEIVKACEQIETLLSKDAKAPWLLKRAMDLFVMNGQWHKAQDCLDKLYKQGKITKAEYQYKKACILVQLNQGLDAFDACPELPQAAILAAKQNPKKAVNIYCKSWAKNPSWSVYHAYIALFAKENSLAQFKRTEQLCMTNKNAKLNDLVMAQAAINAKLWSEAKRLLNGYLATNPLTMGAAAQMAVIESEANHDFKEAQLWIDKAAGAYPDTQYVCSKCMYQTNVWSVTCPNCKEFAGLKIK